MTPLELYDAAVQRERLIRNAAFLPITERIGVFEVKPMTVRHHLALRMAKSPFIMGGAPAPEDVFEFLWLLSTHWPDDLKWKRRLIKQCRIFTPRFAIWKTERWKSQTRQRLETFAQYVKDIHAFVQESELDHPPMSDEPGPSYYSDSAALVDLFGEAYGWTRGEVMDMPIKIMNQLIKLIYARAKSKSGKSPILFNPSDKEKAGLAD